IWAIDENYKTTFINQRMAEMLGYTAPEMIGMQFTFFMFEEDLKEYDVKSKPQGFPERFECKFKHKDGSEIWAKVSATPLKDESGSFRGSFAMFTDITKQKRMEDALEDSEKKYREVFNKANDMISLNLMNGDMPGNFIEINNIGVQRLGYSKEELLNMSPKDIVAPDKRPEIPENARKLYEKGHNTFEIIHLTKGGKRIPIEVNNHLISFNEQAVCLAISRDITERKNVEEQIKTEHQKLLDIIEFLPNATFVIDEDKKIIAWNKAIEKMTGISKKEMIGKGNHEYSIPFYGIRRSVLIDLIFLEKEKIESEYNFVRREGNTLFAEVFLKNLFDGKGAYVFVKASPLYDDKGNIVGAIESIRDITERKEIEQDLKESEEKYRWLFEVSPLYLILVGLDGRLMDVNQAACDFVGTSKEDLMAKHFSELGIMPEEELPLHYDNVTRILKGEEIEPYESKYIDKNGEIHFAVTHESPIKKDGEVIAFQIICVDTTERKKMEEALKEEKEFAENLIETANVIVLGLDPEGKVNIFNSAAEKITGYSSEEILGNSFELILPRERYGYVWSKFYSLMEGELPKYYENPILTKSGEERFITWQNNELYKDGQIIG
ncbi:MAG: PAS domain S-box protein, partial [Methanobacterium sp.]